MQPKISIITPVLNRKNFIEETILSVVNQNYSNLEYIIIDGGSSDGTTDILKKHEKSISYWESSPDKGMYYAIQKGIEKSSGEIIGWLNSDDKLHPDSLDTIASIFSDLDVEWITGIPTMFNQAGKCVKVSKIEKWSESRFWINDYKWIQQESVYWKRSLWEKSGGKIDTSLKYAGDIELWWRFFKYSKLYSVNTILAGFRLHGSQLSVNFKKEYELEAKQVIKKDWHFRGSEIFRYSLLRFFQLMKSFINLTYLLKFTSPLIHILIGKLHFFPKTIYFDFETQKWKK